MLKKAYKTNQYVALVAEQPVNKEAMVTVLVVLVSNVKCTQQFVQNVV
jgi:hypothetical protein